MKSTWVWDEPDPMSNYLATVGIGQWQFKTGTTPGGIPETVGLDPTLLQTNPTAMGRCYIDYEGTIIFAGEYYMPGKEIWDTAS